MGKFTIQPHGRLQEWIADEKGYFREEGLDYEFGHGLSAASEKKLDASGAVAEVRLGDQLDLGPEGEARPDGGFQLGR